MVVTILHCRSGAVLVYTTQQLGAVLGALSGIHGRNCRGGEDSHDPVLVNALLFSGACCCWELGLISHCRQCLGLSCSLVLWGNGGSESRPASEQTLLWKQVLIPSFALQRSRAQAHQTIPEDLDTAPELPHQKKPTQQCSDCGREHQQQPPTH